MNTRRGSAVGAVGAAAGFSESAVANLSSRALLGLCLAVAGPLSPTRVAAVRAEHTPANRVVRDSEGAIVRGDVAVRKLALVFTGDEHAQSSGPILDILRARGIRAGFFVTGRFARRPELRPLFKRILIEGHYLGPHSDSHPLYCDWEDRGKSLVTKEFFGADLRKNLASLRKLGGLQANAPVYFIPPHEWYNREHVAWTREMGITLVNFTPGSGSNRDYALEGSPAFVPSQQIYDDILTYERKDPHGLNGFLLLFHLGSGRRDPFHSRLGALCDELNRRGYEIVRVDSLLRP